MSKLLEDQTANHLWGLAASIGMQHLGGDFYQLHNAIAVRTYWQWTLYLDTGQSFAIWHRGTERGRIRSLSSGTPLDYKWLQLLIDERGKFIKRCNLKVKKTGKRQLRHVSKLLETLTASDRVVRVVKETRQG